MMYAVDANLGFYNEFGAVILRKEIIILCLTGRKLYWCN